uniref:5'-nucleotidase/2',3'-cyclic phosphodiesterase and related esterases n=1 Tax=uncultured Thiotrichaceae bacterium TaxID=298394 RepID=A0A6S6TCG5_9GAMM|nr:MAG: 5'-nucleotidase/2',3'-cyclic phosphodiesterase and related esterases [uncultured Thiotrichaceae bacterium]
MNPDNIMIQVRQRSEWEAVDMGFKLVQKLWQQILPTWLMLLLPLALGLVLIMPEEHLWVAGMIIWWLRPLYDRVILHILSRNLFGEKLRMADVFSALPDLIKNTGLFSALTWRRFSFSRSYNLPVWQLERLRGKALSERKELLYLQGHSQAVFLTISCVLLQLIIALSLVALSILLDPTGQVWEHWKGLFTGTSGSDIEYALGLIDYSTQLIALIVIEPFFVAAGFTLYLNRRTQLEAWDIELSFRSIGKRLTEKAAKQSGLLTLTAACIVSLLLLQPTPAHAASEEYVSPQRLSAEQSSEVLKKVMQAEELSERRQITTWMPRDKSKNKDDYKLSNELIAFISNIFKMVLWAIVMVLLLLAVIYRHRILAMLKPTGEKAESVAKPDVLFGMDVRPDSLPDDIAGTAHQFWQQGEQRNALSLLYRGALIQLMHHDSLAIADSHTEGDILSLARPELSESRFDYINKLTVNWRNIAYAHRTPDDEHIETLLNNWSAFQSADPEKNAIAQEPA